MRKRGIIASAVLLAFLLSLHLTSPQDFQKAINEEDRLIVAEGSRIYAIGISEGRILWEHEDEGKISGMEMMDWNSDGEKDLVVASRSRIMPPLKILDGKTGEILKGFYPVEKTYEGNVLQPVENLKVINSEILFSSGWMLYGVNEEVKRLGLFKNKIGKIEEDAGVQGRVKVTSYVENQRNEDLSRKMTYALDLEGEILGVDEITGSIAEELDFNDKKFLDKNNCQRRHFKSLSPGRTSVAGAILNRESDFYCLNGFLYYLNGSDYLVRRSLETERETPLRRIECSGNLAASRRVLGENVMCGGTVDLKNGKKVAVAGRSDEFFAYYDGEKELVMKNEWPFGYRHGNVRGNVGFEILKGNEMHDFSEGWDYDKDGKKEVMLFFGNGETDALVLLETSTGQKELITLMLTERQVKNRNDSLKSDLTEMQKRLEEIEKKEARENDEKNDLARRIDEKNDERRREDNETERRKIDGEIRRLEDRVDDAEDEIAELRKDGEGLVIEIEMTRREMRKLNSGGGQAKIKSFDFCSGKLFVNSREGVYVFEHGKEKKEMSFSGDRGIDYLNPHYVACLDGGKLGTFTYADVYVSKEDGTETTKKTSSKRNGFLMTNQKAVRVKSGGKIYLPATDGNETRRFFLTYDSKGNLESEKEVENEVFLQDSREGKMFFCLERFEGDQKAYLLDGGILDFSFSRPENLGYGSVECEKLIVDDCDGDGRNELSFWVRTNETGERSRRICLNENERSFVNVTGEGTILEGRAAGEYFVKTKESGNFFHGARERKNLEFPHEIYDGNGERVLVSLKPVFLESGGFVGYGGGEIESSRPELIKGAEVDQNEVLIEFGIPGEKMIFVDGVRYERTRADETVLKLAAGDREIKAYYYDVESGNVYLDEEKVKIESSNPVSPVSWILPVIFMIATAAMILARRRNE